MEPGTTRKINDTPFTQNLYMAIELSNEKWKLGFTIGFGQSPRLRDVEARDLTVLVQEVRMAKERFGLPWNVSVVSCYEAGRDVFWLHRYLRTLGITTLVVDSASIEVNRRKRRAKTDRMDVGKLLTMLMRYHQGEKKAWSLVHIPGREDEDQRQLHRELMALKAEQTHHINRIKGLLASQGVALPFKKDFLSQLETVQLWDGTSLPSALHARLKREYERYQLVKKQINQLELEREEAVRTSTAPAVQQVRQLLKLKGIGINSAWVYVMEFLAWRGFRYRREVGSLAGLTPTPYQSGEAPGNKVSARQAIAASGPWRSRSPGPGCAFSLIASSGAGIKSTLEKGTVGFIALASLPWLAGCWLSSGSTSRQVPSRKAPS
jgi:transposase